jgi:hypothetical protein
MSRFSCKRAAGFQQLGVFGKAVAQSPVRLLDAMVASAR